MKDRVGSVIFDIMKVIEDRKRWRTKNKDLLQADDLEKELSNSHLTMTESEVEYHGKRI